MRSFQLYLTSSKKSSYSLESPTFISGSYKKVLAHMGTSVKPSSPNRTCLLNGPQYQLCLQNCGEDQSSRISRGRLSSPGSCRPSVGDDGRRHMGRGGRGAIPWGWGGCRAGLDHTRGLEKLDLERVRRPSTTFPQIPREKTTTFKKNCCFPRGETSTCLKIHSFVVLLHTFQAQIHEK